MKQKKIAMKSLFTLLVLSLFLFSMNPTVTGQDYQSMSKEELSSEKQKAIENENYALAEKINKILKSKKTVEELIAEKNEKLSQAVSDEDYKLAAKLQKDIKKLKEAQSLSSAIEQAVANEDFRKAETLKNKQEQLIALATSNAKPAGIPQKNTSNSQAEPSSTTVVSTPATTMKNDHTATADKNQDSEIKSTEFEPPKSFTLRERSINASMVFGNALFKHEGGSQMYDAKVGFRIEVLGASNIYHFSPDIAVRLFAGTGFMNFNLGLDELSIKVNTYYLTSTVGIKTNYKGLFAMLGFHADLGLWGKQKYETSGSTIDVFADESLKRYNVGLSYRLGYRYKDFDLFINNRIGLVNVEGAEDTAKGEGSFNRSFLIGVSYYLPVKNTGIK